MLLMLLEDGVLAQTYYEKSIKFYFQNVKNSERKF